MQIPNHTQIPNEILDETHLYSESELKVILAICRKTIGWHKQEDNISFSQIAEITGLSSASISKALKELEEIRLITVTRKDGITNHYYINYFETTSNSKEDHFKIQRGTTSNFEDTKETSKETNKRYIYSKKKKSEVVTEEQEKIIARTIEILNEKTKSHFQNKGQTRETILKRIRDGYTFEDLQKAIIAKAWDWMSNEEMEKYLRPFTLFCPSKIDGYIAEYDREKHDGKE